MRFPTTVVILMKLGFHRDMNRFRNRINTDFSFSISLAEGILLDMNFQAWWDLVSA